MSRRANVLVLLCLAIGVFYGRFAVPWLLELVLLERQVDEWNSEVEKELSERLARQQQEEAAQAVEAQLKQLDDDLRRLQAQASSLQAKYRMEVELLKLDRRPQLPLPGAHRAETDEGKATVLWWAGW